MVVPYRIGMRTLSQTMPVKSPPKERPIIELFFSAYENETWKDAVLDWVEEKQDGAVEVIATKRNRTTVALEHTLIQPFVNERFDSEVFIKAFGRIERNPVLILPGQDLDVIIPVHAVPRGYDWDEVGMDLLTWLVTKRMALPTEDVVHRVVTVGKSAKSGPLRLTVKFRTTSMPGMTGNCLISRDTMPGTLTNIVEKALATKEQLMPMLEVVQGQSGQRPDQVIADSGYCSEKNLQALESAEDPSRRVEGFIATERQKHDEYREPCPRGPLPKGATRVDRMKRKLKTRAAKAVYAARKTIVEPVFGQIKQGRGFRQFLLRGLDKVRGEWSLVCLTHNVLKLYRLCYA